MGGIVPSALLEDFKCETSAREVLSFIYIKKLSTINWNELVSKNSVVVNQRKCDMS